MTAAVAVIADGYELDPAEGSLSALVGARLREVRQQRGWSLADVERDSSQAIKVSILGAYERGERNLSVNALGRIAAHYGVPVWELIPSAPRAALSERQRCQLAKAALAIDAALREDAPFETALSEAMVEEAQ